MSRQRRSTGRLKGLLRPKNFILAGTVALIGYLTLVPLSFLLWSTFVDSGAPTLEFFHDAYRTANLAEMALNSLWFAIGSATLAVSVGTTLAYLTVRTDMPFKRALFVIALIPLIIPGILHTVAWIFLANPRIGLINKALEILPGNPTLDIFSMGGMILVEGLHLAPLIFLLMAAAFRSMDTSLEESAFMSGASLPSVIRRITLPLVRPALYASILIAFIRSLEAFEVPALLGIPRGIWVFSSRIWRALSGLPADFEKAGAYSVSLLAIIIVLLLLHNRLSTRGNRFQTVTGKAHRPRVIALGKWRTPAMVVAALYIIFAVVLPLFILVYVSTQDFYSTPSFESIRNGTLDNYRATLTDPQTLRALRNSLLLGLGTATSVMFVTAIASWMVVKTRWRGRWLIDGVASLPLVIPGLVVGVALLFVYLRAPLPIYGTIWILFIAYLTRYMPYGMRYASSSMYQISDQLEEAAHMSGAGWWHTFQRIHLPLIIPGLIAGWVYIVIVSIRELSSSILLYSPGSEVLSVVIWQQWANGQFSELAALGVLMIAMLVVLVAMAQRLGAQLGVKENR